VQIIVDSPSFHKGTNMNELIFTADAGYASKTILRASQDRAMTGVSLRPDLAA
jgi:hypothetical protein